jgi:hypothetical protein
MDPYVKQLERRCEQLSGALHEIIDLSGGCEDETANQMACVAEVALELDNVSIPPVS